MKQAIRNALLMMCMVCFGINAINGILIFVTHNYGGEPKIDYLFPLATVICAFLSGLVYLVFYIPKINFITKCIIHFLSLVGVVTLCSFWFKWITEPIDLIIVYAVLLVIYGSIWIVMYNKDLKNAEKINEALEKTKDLD